MARQYYKDSTTGQMKPIGVKVEDTLPVGTEVDYDGSTIPEGWEEVDDPNEYSTNEVRVGTWIDGKPLYRKTIDFGALPNNSDKNVDLGINNLDLITSMRGITKRPGSNTMVIPTVSSGLSGMIVLYVDSSNKLHISTGEDRSSYTKTYITIEYTKTSD